MFHGQLRTALDLKRAIDVAPQKLRPIGRYVSKEKSYKDNLLCVDVYGEGEEEDDDSDDDKDGAPTSRNKKRKIMKTAELSRLLEEKEKAKQDAAAQADAVKRLTDIFDSRAVPAHRGWFEKFTLRVTQAGCEFEGTISSRDNKDASYLAKWYEHGIVSPFGDVGSQENRVDLTVRDAREIPASAFHVPDELLRKIETAWAQKGFLPAAVRAEPYKIHVYGPGGQFKSHLDTPEAGLVGTFLVGLGDTTRGEHLVLGHPHDAASFAVNASPCTWVAFYPDTPHHVKKIEKGYRAVAAFKLFIQDSTEAALALATKDGRHAELNKEIQEVLKTMPAPYGIMLQHQYCVEVSELNGFDNTLHAAATAVAATQNLQVHFLPVMTKLHAFEDQNEASGYLERGSKVRARVFPLTNAHVDALVRHVQQGADDAQPEIQLEDEPQWLKGLEGISFYSLDSEAHMYDKGELLDLTAVTWTQKKDRGAEYTGNESRPLKEDSIYLSYAMIVTRLS